MNTSKLNELYDLYKINTLCYGKNYDKLGDVYEDYCKYLLSSKDLLYKAQAAHIATEEDIEYRLFISMMNSHDVFDFSGINKIMVDEPVPNRNSHGKPKTDLIANIIYANGNNDKWPISCKQSQNTKVAIAEFSVDTICSEIGITNFRLKELLTKFQVTASALTFTKSEKQELRDLMKPILRIFDRWALTGSINEEPTDLRVPTTIVRFQLNKIHEFQSCSVYTIENYIDKLINGAKRGGGFGTGLSWTYATGSKGHKIQFKG